jgi:hypothetical protein
MEAERKQWVTAKSWRDGHSKGPVGGDEIVMVLNAELAGELRTNVSPPAEPCSALPVETRLVHGEASKYHLRDKCEVGLLASSLGDLIPSQPFTGFRVTSQLTAAILPYMAVLPAQFG